MKFVLKYNEIFVEGNKAKGERSEKILENPLTNGWKIGIIIKSLQDDMSY